MIRSKSRREHDVSAKHDGHVCDDLNIAKH